MVRVCRASTGYALMAVTRHNEMSETNALGAIDCLYIVKENGEETRFLSLDSLQLAVKKAERLGISVHAFTHAHLDKDKSKTYTWGQLDREKYEGFLEIARQRGVYVGEVISAFTEQYFDEFIKELETLPVEAAHKKVIDAGANRQPYVFYRTLSA